ncbi:MAG: Rv3235 family protein [Actinomycetota bacterium]|nr:Rv3235 family protein [Actinomycetota bacterium]
MKTATSLLVRTAPEPRFGISSSAPEQVPLPLAGISQLTVAPVASRGASHNPLQERASHFMQVLVEVLSGERPVRQLGAWMSPDVYDQLQGRLAAQARAPRQMHIHAGSRIVSVHVAMVTETTAEIAARMAQGGRSRALAVRLELQSSSRGVRQWRCTALTWA